MRQRDANLTALAAIGPRKKRKVDSPGPGSGTEVRSVMGAEGGATQLTSAAVTHEHAVLYMQIYFLVSATEVESLWLNVAQCRLTFKRCGEIITVRRMTFLLNGGRERGLWEHGKPGIKKGLGAGLYLSKLVSFLLCLLSYLYI